VLNYQYAIYDCQSGAEIKEVKKTFSWATEYWPQSLKSDPKICEFNNVIIASYVLPLEVQLIFAPPFLVIEHDEYWISFTSCKVL